MALNDLMRQLQENAFKSESRVQESQSKIRELGSMQAAAAASLSSQINDAGLGGGGATGGGDGKFKLNGGWPAVGERHQHNDSIYSKYKWAGDINVPGSGDYGNRVGAYQSGRVIGVNHWDNSYGNHVLVRHPNGTVTMYAHLSETDVRKGQRVRKGQMLGRVGSSGNSSGPHLHFEIR